MHKHFIIILQSCILRNRMLGEKFANSYAYWLLYTEKDSHTYAHIQVRIVSGLLKQNITAFRFLA